MTPDSFSDGGLYVNPVAAVERASELWRLGADRIDIGGESTRPAGEAYGVGYVPVSEKTEIERIVPVIGEVVSAGFDVSVDTTKAGVASAAIDKGASTVNDVSCAASAELLSVVANSNAEYVLMHNRWNGSTVPSNTQYTDLVSEVLKELISGLERCLFAGIAKERIWIDPGLGFAKTSEQSVALLADLARFQELGCRVLVGPSRKSFIADTVGGELAPSDRLGGTIAAVVYSLHAGVQGVRVHDVRQIHQAVRFTESVFGQHAGELC